MLTWSFGPKQGEPDELKISSHDKRRLVTEECIATPCCCAFQHFVPPRGGATGARRVPTCPFFHAGGVPLRCFWGILARGSSIFQNAQSIHGQSKCSPFPIRATNCGCSGSSRPRSYDLFAPIPHPLGPLHKRLALACPQLIPDLSEGFSTNGCVHGSRLYLQLTYYFPLGYLC